MNFNIYTAEITLAILLLLLGLSSMIYIIRYHTWMPLRITAAFGAIGFAAVLAGVIGAT